jgi:hypothetical protein
VRTDIRKEFVNALFRKLLDMEGIEVWVYRNPDVKSAIAERFKRTP